MSTSSVNTNPAMGAWNIPAMAAAAAVTGHFADIRNIK